MKSIPAVASVLLLGGAIIAAEPPAFEKKPAVKAGDAVRIDFIADRQTDVDPFGRVFFPNLGQFRIEVVDTNNNPITTFGKYGNEDSGGPNALVKRPDIPLAWPTSVAASDKWAYVADTVNRRVVRVKLAYAADESCPCRERNASRCGEKACASGPS
jgi:hypothetical protein